MKQVSGLFIFYLIFELTHLNLLKGISNGVFEKEPAILNRALGVANDHGREIKWRKRSVVLGKIGDQEMTVESLTILIIKDPSGEVVEIGDSGRKGENPMNMTTWQTLKNRMEDLYI